MTSKPVVESVSQSVAKPYKLKQVNLPQKLSNTLSPEQLQDLFVEMCFFARLGFVQPPCCLRCAHDTISNNGNSNMTGSTRESEKRKCSNLVVWRVIADGSHLLHPEKLKDNTLILICSAARSLLRGEVVQKMKWDSKARKLVAAS